MEQAPHNLSQWVKHLSKEEVPILANTVRTISDITSNPETSAAELSQVILQDSSMTARVLRIANSVHYNYNSNNSPINTVSRAIVILGFDVVRSISLTISMVNTLLQGERHEKVLNEMARAFHAAVQAKAIAIENGDTLPEEVFIAALLHRFGNLIFWCFPYGMSDRLIEEIALSSDNEEVAERRVLGFSLTDLSGALNREWHLSSLMESAMRGDKRNSRVAYIQLASRISLAVEKGWENDEVNKLLNKIGALLDKKPEMVFEFVSNNAQLARETALEYGAMAAGRLIPLPPLLEEIFNDNNDKKTNVVTPDLQLQLRILRELSGMLTEKLDLNAVIGTVLEGILRGLRMDRAWFAIMSPDGSLTIRYILGDEIKKLNNSLLLESGSNKMNIFHEVSRTGNPRWVKNGLLESYKLPTHAAECLSNEFFLMPITLAGASSGIFYCDRHHTGAVMDEESFQGFRHFCEHVSIALTLLKK